MANLNIADYTHPGVIDILPFWTQMNVTYAGEHAVKAAGTDYLPMTDGQRADYLGKSTPIPLSSEETGGSNLRTQAISRYNSYKLRAIFPNYTRETIVSMLGVMFAEKPTKLELPAGMDAMILSATPYNDSLEMVMRRTNENQLLVGRRGLLLEPPKSGTNMKIIEYAASTILNWHTRIEAGANVVLDYVLLDESGPQMVDLKWANVKRYRILALDANSNYYSFAFDENMKLDEFDLETPPESVVYPELLGKRYNQIPFVFANSTSVLPDLDLPPLLALSDMCLSIYRGDADYRQHLYQQAQDTAFFSGFAAEELNLVRLGAGATVGSTNADADFKMVGVSSQGLPEERQSQENLHTQAMSMGIALVEQSQVESNAALKTRLSVKTASMKTIALSGARAIESLLKYGAEWLGKNPDDVVIESNLDFSGAQAAAKDLLDLWSTKQQGAPLSEKSYHAFMRRNDYTDMSYDDEIMQIEEEGGIAGSTLPTQ